MDSLFSNNDIIGLIGISVTIIGIIVSLLVEEIRDFLKKYKFFSFLIISCILYFSIINVMKIHSVSSEIVPPQNVQPPDNGKTDTEEPNVKNPPLNNRQEEPSVKPTEPSDRGNSKPEPKRLQAVYLESIEKNHTQQSTIIANRLKSALSAEGYSFTESLTQSSYRLKITATTRHHGTEYGLTICYADVAVALFDIRNNKNIFQDEFSQKGISSTREAAGRKALEDAVPIIVSKIPTWIEVIKN